MTNDIVCWISVLFHGYVCWISVYFMVMYVVGSSAYMMKYLVMSFLIWSFNKINSWFGIDHFEKLKTSISKCVIFAFWAHYCSNVCDLCMLCSFYIYHTSTIIHIDLSVYILGIHVFTIISAFHCWFNSWQHGNLNLLAYDSFNPLTSIFDHVFNS